MTGRSVLRLVGNKKGAAAGWEEKVVDSLIKKEGEGGGAKKPRTPEATGAYAETDPFEIAKKRYATKESNEELARKLKEKLDGKPDYGFRNDDE